MQSVALASMLGGGILQAGSRFSQGQAASRMANLNANQLEGGASRYNTVAGQEEASAQRLSSEKKRQAKLIESRIIAQTAAAGGDTTDKNISDLLANTAGEGEYAALSALYEGETRADVLRNEAINLRNKAMFTRYEGKQVRRAANMAAIGTILGTGAQGASFYSKYNNKAPTDISNNSDMSDTNYLYN